MDTITYVGFDMHKATVSVSVCRQDVERCLTNGASRAVGSGPRGSRGGRDLIENRFRPADLLVRLAHPAKNQTLCAPAA
jgi:hypothetical protein